MLLRHLVIYYAVSEKKKQIISMILTQAKSLMMVRHVEIMKVY